MFIAIPSISSFYFTANKEYEVFNKGTAIGDVTCDAGHRRTINLDEKPSAHLWNPSEHARNERNPMLGYFKIVEKND